QGSDYPSQSKRSSRSTEKLGRSEAESARVRSGRPRLPEGQSHQEHSSSPCAREAQPEVHWTLRSSGTSWRTSLPDHLAAKLVWSAQRVPRIGLAEACTGSRPSSGVGALAAKGEPDLRGASSEDLRSESSEASKQGDQVRQGLVEEPLS